MVGRSIGRSVGRSVGRLIGQSVGDNFEVAHFRGLEAFSIILYKIYLSCLKYISVGYIISLALA